MAISAKQAGVTFIVVLIIGTLALLYTSSRVIIFTKAFTSEIEIHRNELEVSSREIFATLNRIEKIRSWPGICPGQFRECSASDGEVQLLRDPTSGAKPTLRISTQEVTNIWTPMPDISRHKAFVEAVAAAFRLEGYVVIEVQ